MRFDLGAPLALPAPPRFPAWWQASVQHAEDLARAATAGLALRRASALRSRARNAAVGGGPRSQHLIGTAIDYVGSEAAMQQAARRFRALHPRGFATVHAVSGGERHLHLQLHQAGTVPESIYRAVAR